jgi:hypothetical protein
LNASFGQDRSFAFDTHQALLRQGLRAFSAFPPMLAGLYGKLLRPPTKSPTVLPSRSSRGRQQMDRPKSSINQMRIPERTSRWITMFHRSKGRSRIRKKIKRADHLCEYSTSFAIYDRRNVDRSTHAPHILNVLRARCSVRFERICPSLHAVPLEPELSYRAR